MSDVVTLKKAVADTRQELSVLQKAVNAKHRELIELESTPVEYTEWRVRFHRNGSVDFAFFIDDDAEPDEVLTAPNAQVAAVNMVAIGLGFHPPGLLKESKEGRPVCCRRRQIPSSGQTHIEREQVKSLFPAGEPLGGKNEGR